MIKSRRNYSFKKAGDIIRGAVAEMLTDMARYQTEAIQRGIADQVDIKGKKFAPLSNESTLPIRNKRGQGFLPLDRMKGARQKKLRNIKMIPAKPNNLVSQVQMLAEHGVYHNEGFTTSSNSMIPGKKVPKREWFGITKDMQKSGKQYKEFVRMTLFKLARSLRA
tara:strand:- start:350 stop:844 length:495 start_codon:yes stop_codon:yes gene_type:complete